MVPTSSYTPASAEQKDVTCVYRTYMYSVMLYVRGGLEYFINTATRSADRAAAGRVAATLGSLLGYSQYNVHGHASCALAVRLGEGVADLTNEPAMSYPPPSASPPRSALARGHTVQYSMHCRANAKWRFHHASTTPAPAAISLGACSSMCTIPNYMIPLFVCTHGPPEATSTPIGPATRHGGESARAIMSVLVFRVQ